MKIETLPLSKINSAKYNPRTITEDALNRLEASIEEFGLVDPLIVNERTGMTLIGGHQRLKILRKQGATEATCTIVDLPPDKEKALNIALNNQKMAGEYDFTGLADLLSEIDTGNLDVAKLTGFDQQELAKIAEWAPSEDHVPMNDRPKKPKQKCPECGHEF